MTTRLLRRISRSALIQAALEEYLKAQRQAREAGERRKALEDACKRIDRVAERLGTWNAVRAVRKSRETHVRRLAR